MSKGGICVMSLSIRGRIGHGRMGRKGAAEGEVGSGK